MTGVNKMIHPVTQNVHFWGDNVVEVVRAVADFLALDSGDTQHNDNAFHLCGNVVIYYDSEFNYCADIMLNIQK